MFEYKILVTQNNYKWVIDTALTLEQAEFLKAHYQELYEAVEIVCPITAEGL